MMDGYATHLPVVAAAAQWSAQFDLPILELGCGDYSTPLLRAMAQGRELHVASSDPEWNSKYKDIVDHLEQVPSRDSWQQWRSKTGIYGMCLLDNEELVLNRIKHIPRLLENCAIIVMHDWRDNLPFRLEDYSSEYGIYKRWEPWTMWIRSPVFPDGTPFQC